MSVIDAHHHLWRYSSSEFDWIDDGMAKLRRDFLPEDFETEVKVAGVDGTVVVQARQSLEETRWLCGLASASSMIRGVVGWAAIASPDFEHVLSEMKQLPKLVGLRHVVQGEAPGFLDAEAFNHGVSLLKDADLAYDILIFERQLEEAIRFVDRHPSQPFVLDHIAKPRIAAAELEPWRTHIREIARRPNVVCKLSGIVTEAEWSNWTLETLRPYLDTCLEAFGPERLMAGSDWPVCLLASGYEHWWSTLRAYFTDCSEQERDAVFGGTASRFYHLREG